ncbi:MAG: SlyX family protein [Myxococcota bacterium]|nr:SlyX family protein [Myxococcota bacterium]
MNDDTSTLLSRMTDLEIRYTHQALMLDELSDVVREQSEQLTGLSQEVKRLTEVLQGLDAPRHERPPHY